MARKRKTYLSTPPRERVRARVERERAATGGPGLLGRLRGRLPRLRARRELVIVGGIALAAVVGLACLGTALLLAKIDRDWASVAKVNGHDISREELRSQLSITRLLEEQRSALITRFSGSQLTANEAYALQSRVTSVLGDPVAAAREELIDEELLRQLAGREKVAVPSNVDPWAEVSTYVSADLCHKVRYVRFGLPTGTSSTDTPTTPRKGIVPWPTASQANIEAATGRLRTELAADTPVETIVADLHDAGWKVLGVDSVVSQNGLAADPSLELDSSIAAGAVRGKTGDLVGPTTDLYGRVSMGRVLIAPSSAVNFGQDITKAAQKARLDQNALRRWAESQALRRAVSDSLLQRWVASGVEQARFHEFVIGDAPASSTTAGPWVELSVLVLDRLAGVDPASIENVPAGLGKLDFDGTSLAKALNGLPLADRTSLFRTLVHVANGTDGTASPRSGEVGFVTKEQALPEIGKPAFADGVKTGAVLGPIATASGPELFLVEARYPGALDEHGYTALSYVRADANPNAINYTLQFSPADVALARQESWRGAPEFEATEPVRSALFDTPIGVLSDPFILDGKLALAVVTERKTDIPELRMRDRLALDGFAVWFASERSKATIWRSDDTLPELRSPTPRPTSTFETVPPLETPRLPTIPGLPETTPVKTDEMGLPALP
jgi:hypothetical protein